MTRHILIWLVSCMSTNASVMYSCISGCRIYLYVFSRAWYEQKIPIDVASRWYFGHEYCMFNACYIEADFLVTFSEMHSLEPAILILISMPWCIISTVRRSVDTVVLGGDGTIWHLLKRLSLSKLIGSVPLSELLMQRVFHDCDIALRRDWTLGTQGLHPSEYIEPFNWKYWNLLSTGLCASFEYSWSSSSRAGASTPNKLFQIPMFKAKTSGFWIIQRIWHMVIMFACECALVMASRVTFWIISSFD